MVEQSEHIKLIEDAHKAELAKIKLDYEQSLNSINESELMERNRLLTQDVSNALNRVNMLVVQNEYLCKERDALIKVIDKQRKATNKLIKTISILS